MSKKPDLSDVDILIPFRGGDPQREAVWDFIAWQWQQLSIGTGLRVCEASDGREPGEPFNLSAAQNHAFEQSDRPYLIMLGADCLPDVDNIVAARDYLHYSYVHEPPWIPLFRTTEYFNDPDTTEIIVAGRVTTQVTDEALNVPFCCGPVALTRQAYIDAGGMDERFSGWGGEDAAFRQCLANLYGVPEPLPFTLRCLWHSGEHRRMPQRHFDLCREYESLSGLVAQQQHLRERGTWLRGAEMPSWMSNAQAFDYTNYSQED